MPRRLTQRYVNRLQPRELAYSVRDTVPGHRGRAWIDLLTHDQAGPAVFPTTRAGVFGLAFFRAFFQPTGPLDGRVIRTH